MGIDKVFVKTTYIGIHTKNDKKTLMFPSLVSPKSNFEKCVCGAGWRAAKHLRGSSDVTVISLRTK